ncbi:hypothetical protein BGZ76_001352 [Entomortierella beljakovae]|nr:hypothetical protein BGZ76_001352 [Entomortierella beljakovae]
MKHLHLHHHRSSSTDNNENNNNGSTESTGHITDLTQQQWDTLGEIWSFLLHLWYSEPLSPTTSNSSHSRKTSGHGISFSPSSPKWESSHTKDDSQHSPISPSSPKILTTTESSRSISPTPASPTRLSQSFQQVSIATSPPRPTSPLNTYLPGGAASAAAALRRSAAKLKPWLPAKKFTFKYSPAEYQTAFWSFVQIEHPDVAILRFLRARKWNVEKAMEMLILALEWRIAQGVDEIMQMGELEIEAKYPGFLEQLKSGKVRFRGRDRQGRLLCFMDVSLHNPHAQSPQAVEKLAIYIVESARLMMAPQETISIVFDMSGFSMSNMDWSAFKFLIHAAEACYPELLGVALIHKAPWIFGALWKVISPMLDPVIRTKIKFTNNHSDLDEYIAKDQLMSIKPYDGLDNVPYVYTPPVPDEDKLLHQDSEAKHRAINKLREMELTFERLTEIWQGQKQLSSNVAVMQERHEVGKRMAEAWWAAFPYTRAKTVYHRMGAIQPQITS